MLIKLTSISVFCCLLNIVFSSKLNVPRVLLPIFDGFSTKFILEATDGDCYKWTTSRTDIIKLIPYDMDFGLDCSSKVIVLTSTKERTRNMAIVLAEDFYTNQVLRCDVIVDVIDSLDIITTTRELYVEEAPEAFEVRAYDSQGNEFTTLEGIEFDWNILPTSTLGGPSGIRFITFKDSPYEAPASIESFEDENKRGHTVLLAGFKTGSAKVKVNLPHYEYRNVKGHEVQLSVIANLIITPPEVYMMVGDTVEIKVIQLNSGRMANIDLSLSNYQLQLENKSVATIDSSLIVTGLQVGDTKITVYDPNIPENENGKLPSCTVHVVEPAHMMLTILPYKNWAILLTEHHDIVAEVYTKDGHKLHLGDGVKIDIEVGSLFYVHERSDNGSWLTGWAREVGTTPVIGVLHGVVNSILGKLDSSPPISAQAELSIYSHIALDPDEAIFPWDPILKSKYEVQIKASGGDGNFFWSSSNQSIGIVTQTGLVRTHYCGHFQVSAAMLKNQDNKESARIHILPPTKLKIIEYIMEAEVNQPIFLHVALFATKQVKGEAKTYDLPFNKCQELPFVVKLANENFFHNSTAVTTPIGVSCTTICIVGRDVGISKVSVSYTIDGNLLEDTVTVSTFEPLQLISPTHYDIALAVDTSIDVIFSGGPKPLVGRPSVYKRTVLSQSDVVVSAHDITDENPSNKNDLIKLRVHCLKKGSSGVILSITNSPILPNSNVHETSSTISVWCVEPYSISLHPVLKMEDAKTCPIDVSASRVIVPSYKSIEVDVRVRDESDRLLLNISSLRLHWITDPVDMADLGNPNSVFQRSAVHNGVEYADGNYQLITPKTDIGILKLGVVLQGYFKDKFEYVNVDCTSRGNSRCIRDEVYLYLERNAVAIPDVISIYNHPNNKRRVKIVHGSGYYDISLSHYDVVRVKYLKGSRELEIIPITMGEVEIVVTDLCLPSPPVTITATVVSMSSIKVQMLDKVEIGKSITAIVTVYDSYDNILVVPELDLSRITADLGIKIAKLDRVEDKGLDGASEEEILYTVTGTELGNTKITFAIGDIVSPMIDLQVFPPLKIIPRNATLLIGSVFQYSCRGGPQPENIVYNIMNKSIADISNTGIVHALDLGYTKIEALSVGINPYTGDEIVYSQDTVDLHVINMKGVKIKSPLTRFQVGSTIPLWPYGIPEELTPMVLGGAEKPFKYHWKVDDPHILKLVTPFNQYGIHYGLEDEVVMRVVGLAPGRTTVHLDVIVPGYVSSKRNNYHKIFSDSLDIEVFESFALKHPASTNGKLILLSTHSSIQLETNMDGLLKLRYEIPSVSEPVAASGSSNKKSLSIPHPLVTVSNTGLVQSYDKFGIASIIISAMDQFGLKQTINVAVEVKPVHFMLLDVTTNWRVKTVAPIPIIPLGTDFELHGHFYDNAGVKFSATNLKLGVRSTRSDLIGIRAGGDNSSVIISTKKSGDSILRGFTTGFYKNVDYIKLHVGETFSHVIDSLTTGDIICLWTPLVTSNKDAGRWSASDDSLININPEAGIGTVVGFHNGYATLTHSLHPTAIWHLSLFPATEITMLPTSYTILTNAPNTTTRIPLIISSNEISSKSSNFVNGKHCRDLLETDLEYPFTCYLEHNSDVENIDVPSVFNIRSGFDVSTGQYTCDLIPNDDYSAKTHYLVGNVTIWAELTYTDIRAAPVVLPFVPAISVTSNLHLDTSDGILVVNGADTVLDQVQVEPVDGTLLHVGRPERPKSHTLVHRITPLDHHWTLDELRDVMTVIVRSPLTNQKIKVQILADRREFSITSINAYYQSPILNLLYSYGPMGVVTLAVLFITLKAFHYFTQPTVHMNSSALNRPSLNYSGSDGLRPIYRSPSTTINSDRSRSFDSPIYGDPNMSYSSSPDIRRSRKFT
ncbi:hypothetical protein PPYR_03545 [Photinus pyralis]|uniref:BIG2 domain-containing protein n=1 Tax=Photinus pyralis TaxID=7054 RepID=A0A5N4A343_PHOPY|nr:nuclear pore membrane glycoprotein 210 [Photinus pyralis]KAB0791745.1 hypothetical protein PPYR_03545 [Photinus pyralis]